MDMWCEVIPMGASGVTLYSKDSSNGKQVHANERIARAILILLFGSVVSGVDVYMILKKNGKYNVKYRYIYITHEKVIFCLEGAYPKIVVTGVGLVKVSSISRVSVRYYSFLYLQQSAEAKEDNAYGFSKMDALVSAVGVDEDIVYSKSIALQVRFISKFSQKPNTTCARICNFQLEK